MNTVINKIIFLVIVLICVFSCTNKQSLQQYYIASAEDSNFIAIDVPANILNLKENEMTDKQQEMLATFKKINFIAFKKTEVNEAAYEVEKVKIKEVLKGGAYKDLMRLNIGSTRGMVKYLGDDDAIDEIVIYGKDDKYGFAVVRVLGKKMNPAYIMQFMQELEKSDSGFGDLSQLEDLFKG